MMSGAVDVKITGMSEKDCNAFHSFLRRKEPRMAVMHLIGAPAMKLVLSSGSAYRSPPVPVASDYEIDGGFTVTMNLQVYSLGDTETDDFEVRVGKAVAAALEDTVPAASHAALQAEFRNMEGNARAATEVGAIARKLTEEALEIVARLKGVIAERDKRIAELEECARRMEVNIARGLPDDDTILQRLRDALEGND